MVAAQNVLHNISKAKPQMFGYLYDLDATRMLLVMIRVDCVFLLHCVFSISKPMP